MEDAEAIKAQYPELIAFLRERPLFIDEGDLLLAHAGVDLRLDDWHDTEPKDFYWIREPFHKGANNTGKTIIFGHTPLRGLNEDGDFMKLWQHDGKSVSMAELFLAARFTVSYGMMVKSKKSIALKIQNQSVSRMTRGVL